MLNSFQWACLTLVLCVPWSRAAEPWAGLADTGLRGALLAAGDVTASRIQQLAADQMTAIVLMLDATSAAGRERENQAANLVTAAGLELFYWIEVARCPPLANAHPQWMASVQTHQEWRRLFPDAPRPAPDEVIKTYPWVPILSRETFDAQLERVQQLSRDRPEAIGLFLNDLQGAPSACGCGHPLCRWTSDYGERRTTQALGNDAAASFASAVQMSLPKTSVIPVWATECEQHDGAETGLCGGVGCFDGICWQAFTDQLRPLEEQTETLAVLLPFRDLQRDLPIYGQPAGWIREAVELFQVMPPKHGGRAISSSRLIAVLQGWNTSPAEIKQQIRMAENAGTGGFLVAYAPIEQSWEPRLVKWR